MLSPVLESQFDVLKMTQERKYDLLSVLTDEHLTHKLPGQNPTLGGVCKEIGEMQQCYIDSFKTRTLNFDYKYNGDTRSVEAIHAWWKSLDDELMAALQSLDNVAVEQETIQRPDFAPSILTNLHIFREGLLIYYGKASVYLKALEITPPPTFQAWIG